jgi:hypothetical protein
MRWQCSIAALLVACTAGCSQSGIPTLAASSGIVTSAGPASEPNLETAVITSGTPTDVYASLARRVLHCWFGADGPLKRTHVFYAEAASPEEGGAANILLHERDETLGDRRGARAFRIAITREAGSVRVGITNIKMPEPIARLMVQDAQTWARGEDGCETRAQTQTAGPPAARPAGALGKAASGR